MEQSVSRVTGAEHGVELFTRLTGFNRTRGRSQKTKKIEDTTSSRNSDTINVDTDDFSEVGNTRHVGDHVLADSAGEVICLETEVGSENVALSSGDGATLGFEVEILRENELETVLGILVSFVDGDVNFSVEFEPVFVVGIDFIALNAVDEDGHEENTEIQINVGECLLEPVITIKSSSALPGFFCV